MAAGLLDHHAGGRVDVRSAGSAPADTINPAVVEAMAEVGIDITAGAPQEAPHRGRRPASDVVITMGCGDACPVFPGKRYEDWELDDPAGQGHRGRPADPRRDRQARAGAARELDA